MDTIVEHNNNSNSLIKNKKKERKGKMKAFNKVDFKLRN